MNKKETNETMAILRATYPKFYTEATATTLTAIVKVWQKVFENDDSALVLEAVIEYISTEKWAPTPADIKAIVTRKSTPELKSLASEGWQEVIEAIRHIGSYEMQAAMDYFSPITRKIVQSMGWLNICHSTNVMADRAHFIKLYNELRDQAAKAIGSGNKVEWLLPEAKEKTDQVGQKKINRLLGEIGK